MAISAAVCAAWVVAGVPGGGRGNSGPLFFKQLVSTGARFNSMLPRVQQHPDSFSRLAFEDTRKCGAASRAGVALRDLGVFHCPGFDQSQRVVRTNRRRLSVKISAWCAGLNPEFHVRTPAAYANQGYKVCAERTQPLFTKPPPWSFVSSRCMRSIAQDPTSDIASSRLSNSATIRCLIEGENSFAWSAFR